MKILYIFTSPSTKGSSVQTKVLNQIKYLNKAGAECRGAFFSTEVNEVTPLNEYVDFVPVRESNWKYFKASGHKRKIMQAVINYAKIQYARYDLFYFRYPDAGSLLLDFTNKFGNKTAFEHLSIEELELKLHAKENPFGITPSCFLSWLEYSALPLWRERLYGKAVRKNAKLGICNSQEIANFQFKKSGRKYNTVIGGDAVEVSIFPILKRPEFNKELNLVFLKGASTSAEFNGLERLMIALKYYKGDYIINFHILGNQLKREKQFVEDNEIKGVYFHFPLLENELFDFLSNMHLGVATLGLYKKGLNQTTTIKIREYMALGLPFIYAYTDPDLNEEVKMFSLEFPNDDSAIDMQKVVDFAHKVLLDPSHSQKMRKYAEEHLDYEVKMKKLYSNLKKYERSIDYAD